MQFLKIWLLCIVSAIIYGIIHDQVTARVCVEYFTVGHPPVFPTQSPTLLALGWGVIATWWVGAFLGLALAVSARAGQQARRTASELIKPIAILLAIMAVSALLSGIVGYRAASTGRVALLDFGLLPHDTAVRFMADYWAHSASYAVGFLGGIVLCIWVIIGRSRNKMAVAAH